MGRLLSWHNLLGLMTVAAVASLAFFLAPEEKETLTPSAPPVYSHQLKIGNKVLRSYRSPAALARVEENFSLKSNPVQQGESAPSDASASQDPIVTENEASESAQAVRSEANQNEESAGDRPGRPSSGSPAVGSSQSSNSSGARGSQASGSSSAQRGSGQNVAPGGVSFGSAPVSSFTGSRIPTPGSSTSGTSNQNNTPTPSSGANIVKEEPRISGKVKPLVGLITQMRIPELIESAYAANACVAPHILLFDLTNWSVLLDNPLTQSQLEGSTVFKFDPKALNLDLNNPTRYMLHTTGCVFNYKRIITSFYQDQDVDLITTFITSVMNSENSDAIASSNSSTLQQIYESIYLTLPTATDPEAVYAAVSGSPNLTGLFETAFGGGSLTDMQNSAPDINTVTYDTTVGEQAPFTYTADVGHWSSSYPVAYAWYVDGVLQSTSPDWTYTPGPNSPENVVITLVVGRQDSGGTQVDTSVPYQEINWTVAVADNTPPVAPGVSLSVTTSDPTSSRAISVDVATGTETSGVFSGCETFSSFAITESNLAPAPEAFTHTCSMGPVEPFAYTIQSPLDGDVTLYIWGIDARGNITATPSTVSLNLDSTAPVIEFINLQPSYASATTYTYEWTLTEAHASATQNFSVELFDGTSWSSAGTVPLTDGPHSGTTFSTNVALPNVNATNAKLRVTYADTLGQETIATSAEFEINRPMLGASAATIDLGSTPNKSTSAPTSFSFINAGLVPSKSCTSVTFSGANASEFSLESDGCTGTIIPASGSCPMQIKATPQSKGTRSGSITLTCGLDSITADLTIIALNNAPAMASASAIGMEDTPFTIGVLATDTDGDALSYTVVSPPAHGTLTSCALSGSSYGCTYSPDQDYFGPDEFTVKANDGSADSNYSTVSIAVLPINDAPVLTGLLTLVTDEDTVKAFDLVAGADVDNASLTYEITVPPAHGTIACPVLTGTYCTYTPDSNYHGSDSFSYRVTDGSLVSSSISASITINSVNDAPTLSGLLTVTTAEDTVKSFSLVAGADVDGDMLSYEIIAAPTNGTLSCPVATSTACTYTPNTNYNGADSFTYRVTDGTLASGSLTASVTVTAVNDAPTLSGSLSISTNEDTATAFSLVAGSDVDGDTLTYQIVSGPASGTLSCPVATSTSCTYTPNLNFNGTDSFTYRVSDGSLTSGNITASISVSAVNDAPTLSGSLSISTTEDTAKAFNLVAGADVDADTLTYQIVSGPANGTLSCPVATSTSCTYTPNLNYNGSDSFTYRVSDGSLTSGNITASISVSAVNDAPTLSGSLSISTNEDTATAFSLVAGADVDGDTLSYQIVSGTSSGTLSCPVATSTSCTYTPGLNFNGSDSFIYRVSDGSLTSGNLTASITVVAVNDAPVAGPDAALATRDNFGYDFTLNSGTDVDTAAGSLSYKLISAPASGTLSNCISAGSYSTDRTCTYTAPVNFHGTVTFTYLVYDGALESSGVTTYTLTVTDQTSTTPNLTPSNFVSSVTTSTSPLTLTAANCTDISQIMIQESSTAPTTSSSGWQTCSSAAGALSFNPSLTNQQGFRTLRIYGRDPRDNISGPQLVTFVYDSMPPQIAIETVPTLPNNIAYTLKWRLTEASISSSATFKLEYSLNGGGNWITEANVSVGQDGPHSSALYTYSWSVPTGTFPNCFIRLTLTDNTNQTSVVASNAFQILVDMNNPNLLAGQMKINGSSTPPPTPQKYVNVSLKALDGDTNITHFCLKTDNSQPLSSDKCWVAVDAPQPGLTPSPSLNLVNFPFLLGFVPAVYDVYAWTRDLSGNISTNTGTLGMDRVQVEYFSDTPPMVSNFFVSNTTAPPNPITLNEMVFQQGDPVYIKWRAVDDKGILPTISLSYTTNDSVYTQIATNLSNNKNNCDTLNEGGTSLDDDSTGCYAWTSPVVGTQYFKIQLIIEDNANQASSVTSLPLNSSRFRILAGNIDPGVNSSAKSAIISPPGAPGLYSLAVASDGKVFIRDASFGLMYINPKSGVYEQLLAVTGASTGDGGPVSSATARGIYKITMDYNDRLIIWDYDRIRRIDTRVTPMTIETIIGALNNGAAGTQTTDIVSDPSDLRVNPGPPDYAILQPMPNGDIYLQAGPYGTVNDGNTLRIYRGSLPSPTINTIRISGSGTYNDFNGQLSMTTDTLMGYYLDFDVNSSALNRIHAKLQRYPIGCSFFSSANIDLVSYASTPPHPPGHISTCGDWAARTANDGHIYNFNNTVAWPVRVSRFDPVSNTHIPVLGSGSQGVCSDGTPATSCKTNISDVFVSPAGKIFFLDNGLVRVVDESGNVQTLYGQAKTFGDYGLAQDARFNSITFIDHGVGDDVILYDDAEKIIREIRPNQTVNQVIRVAGNGESAGINFSVPATMQSLNGASWNQPGSIAADRTNGNVYFACTWGVICKLDRATGLWEMYSGQGGTHWLTLGDLPRTQVQLGGYTPTILASHNGRMVNGTYSWSGYTSQHSVLRELNTATEISTFLAGKEEIDGLTGCPDGDGNNCNLASAWSLGNSMTYHTGLNVWLYRQGYTLRTLAINNPNGSIGTFASVPDAISSMVWQGNTLYFCNSSGQLRKINYTTNTITTLPFPSSGIQCRGLNLLFKSASGSKPDRLIFPFRQNGLMGIAEYFDP